MQRQHISRSRYTAFPIVKKFFTKVNNQIRQKSREFIAIGLAILTQFPKTLPTKDSLRYSSGGLYTQQ